jgi:hypothetical protein
VNDRESEKHRELAVRIVSRASSLEKEALRVWIEDLLLVRSSNLSTAAKTKEAISITMRSGVALPLVRLIGSEITPEPLKVLAEQLGNIKESPSSLAQKTKESTALIFRQLKQVAWDDRGVTARLAISGSLVGLTLFGGQGAGIAALGTAVGVPLWVVFGAGAAFLGVLYKEITGKSPSSSEPLDRKGP